MEARLAERLATVGAVTGGRGMAAEDLTGILFVTDPQISPDGRRIAFVVTSLSDERDEYLSNIWIVDAAGGAPRRFTAGPRRDVEPRWSPDGTRLAFLSERAPEDKLQLYVMPADGGEPTKLDGARQRRQRPGVVAGWLAPGLRVGGGRPARARERGREAEIPAGARHHLGEVSLQRRGIRLRPTPTRLRRLGLAARRRSRSRTATSSTPIPSGRRTAPRSCSPRPATPNGTTTTRATLARRRQGGTPQQLTATAGPVMLPAFSPDGRSIAYFARPGRNAYGRNVRLYVIPSDGDGARTTCLTDALDRWCGAAACPPLVVPGRPVDRGGRRGPR